MIPNPLVFYRSDDYATLLARLPEHLRPYVDASRPYLVTPAEVFGAGHGGPMGIALRDGNTVGLWTGKAVVTMGLTAPTSLTL